MLHKTWQKQKTDDGKKQPEFFEMTKALTVGSVGGGALWELDRDGIPEYLSSAGGRSITSNICLQ